MHELSLAQGILTVVREYVPADQRAQVQAVRVRVGQLSGVVADSLEFCFQALVEGSELPSARLEIEHIPLRLECRDCGKGSQPDGPRFVCPGCGSGNTRMLSGRELDVVEVELA